MTTPNRSFDLNDLLARARAQAGVDDMPDDEIVEPLQRILPELQTGVACLSDAGIQGMQAYLVGSLVTRMRIRDTIRRHPEILDQEIKAPLFITGLPRTGTTKLQRVLAATGRFQCLPLWKILNPLPVPAAEGSTEDPRIEIAQQMVEQTRQAFPRFYAGHPMVATEPDEESLFLEMSFKADPPCWRARLPDYMQWYMGQRVDSTYRWLKQVLQLLQWQDEQHPTKRPWVLKAPHHLGRIDELLTVFPDATVVHCHRDPLVSIPSAAALAESMWGFCSDKVGGAEAGRFVLTLLSRDMDVCLDARQRWQAAGKTFIDAQFATVTRDPKTVVQRIFESLSLPFDAAAKAAIEKWEADNPPYKHGEFGYTLEQYGLWEQEIKARFARYSESQFC